MLHYFSFTAKQIIFTTCVSTICAALVSSQVLPKFCGAVDATGDLMNYVAVAKFRSIGIKARGEEDQTFFPLSVSP